MNVVLASRIGVFRSLWEHEDEEHERLLALPLSSPLRIRGFISRTRNRATPPRAACYAASRRPIINQIRG